MGKSKARLRVDNVRPSLSGVEFFFFFPLKTSRVREGELYRGTRGNLQFKDKRRTRGFKMGDRRRGKRGVKLSRPQWDNRRLRRA